jgi:adenylate cyclase
MGEAEAAAAGLEASRALANELGHAFSINYVRNWLAIHAIETGDLATTEQMLRTMLDDSTEQGFGIWLTMGGVTFARLVLETDTPAAALNECERALARVRTTGTGCVEAQALSLVGEALRRLGRPGDGLARIDEALAHIEAGDARWAEVEVLRRRAAAQRDLGDGEAASATLGRALEVARRQGARLLELRATADLAGLWGDAGERQRGHELLAACLDGLAESASTSDLRAARALLQRLAS